MSGPNQPQSPDSSTVYLQIFERPIKCAQGLCPRCQKPILIEDLESTVEGKALLHGRELQGKCGNCGSPLDIRDSRIAVARLTTKPSA
jgi:hypothetical protein